MIAIRVQQAAEPRWRWPRAAYVHIPFCAHKCGYCDFASLAGVDHLADRYLTALEREIETALTEPQEVDTIFVGGGTPTRLDASSLSRLMSIIRRSLGLRVSATGLRVAISFASPNPILILKARKPWARADGV